MSPAAASPPSFGRFVESVDLLASDGGRPLELERLPDGRTTLAFRVLDSGERDLTVIGPRLRAVFKIATDVARVVIVRFKPGWSSTLFGVSASELTGRHIPLDALWGANGLRNEEPLTPEQINEAVAYARELGVPEDVINVTDHGNTSWGELFGTERLNIGTDVQPATNPRIAARSANSRVSAKGGSRTKCSGIEHRPLPDERKSHSCSRKLRRASAQRASHRD